MNENKFFEEELEKNHPDIDHSFTSPTMNSGLMTDKHNDPDKFIDNPEYFCHYRS